MKGDVERIVEKIKEKYGFNELKEPLLSECNILHMFLRLKTLLWNETNNLIYSNSGCGIDIYIKKIFDEVSIVSDSWVNYLTSFNANCLQLVDNKKVLEMLIDLLILRNVYYEIRKSS